MKKILLIGATSAIAEATARRFAARGDALFLVARNADHLRDIAADLAVRGAMRHGTATLDVTDFAAHDAMLDAAQRELGGIDIVLIAHGTLSDQAQCQASVDALRREFDINALSTLALLTTLANRLESQGRGTLAVISSVAGDRGRQSNYAYGSAKAALTAFLGGLRQRLAKAGVNVLTIKPGFVDTPMTKGMTLPPALLATPDEVARDIVRAVDRKKAVLYTPPIWALIMLIIRNIPGPIFRRLNL